MQNEVDKIENLLETSIIDEAIESLLYPVLLELFHYLETRVNQHITGVFDRMYTHCTTEQFYNQL